MSNIQIGDVVSFGSGQSHHLSYDRVLKNKIPDGYPDLEGIYCGMENLGHTDCAVVQTFYGRVHVCLSATGLVFVCSGTPTAKDFSID